MTPQAIIDSHIHLWPQDASNEDGHAWMTPGMPLAKPHLLNNYCKASEQFDSSDDDVVVKGVVYIETDRRYDTPQGDLATWAKGPLDEIIFLRDIVEGRYGERDSSMLCGLVPWAPLNQPTPVLEEYLVLAKDMAGPSAWPRVKGFRFLLQAIVDQAQFEEMVFGDSFVTNLRLLGQRGFSFDVGVDQHSGGTWQLEVMARAMEKAHVGVTEAKKVIFIINHMCKPDFSGQGAKFDRWCAAVTAMSKCSKTYMKLSGAFSELPPGLKSTRDIADHMESWVAHIFKCFGAERTIFGSDWPVCNIKGPTGDYSWTSWKHVVQHILEDKAYELDSSSHARIWSATAAEAYRLDHLQQP